MFGVRTPLSCAAALPRHHSYVNFLLHAVQVRVSRKRILESAQKVMELYAKHKAVLELEYFNEVGTGLGPTLEFYTLLSHELQKRSLGMWRTEEPPNVAEPGAAVAMAKAGAEGGSGAVPMVDEQKENKQQGAGRGSRGPSSSDGGAAVPASRQASGSRIARGDSGVGANMSEVAVSHDIPLTSAAEYVYAPFGLFPAPLAAASRTGKVIENFRLLGRTVAKALQDSRLLDLPLSPLFFR